MSSYNPDSEDTTIYKVVVNHEEQYSIWPEHKENPLGWRDVGKVGPKGDCLAYIKEVWTDMRPLSLRKKMEEMAKKPPPISDPATRDVSRPLEESLIDKLCQGPHSVEAGLRPERTAKIFREAIDRSYVHIKFTDTRGGTELGVRLDKGACDFSNADFESAIGTVHLEGDLTLDHVLVRCIADIDLQTLAGNGRLVRVKAKPD